MGARTAVAVLVAAAGLAGCSAATPAAAPAGVPSTASSTVDSPVPSSAPALAPTSSLPLAPAVVRYVFPVHGMNSYAHTHHDYPATDIIAACGTPVVAVTSGVVLEVTRVDRYNASANAGPTRGGLSVSLLGDDGVRYYGSHFSSVDATVVPGLRVAPGQPLGLVGRTGDAGACHLHFGISPPCSRTGDWWIQRGVIWPWPYLDAWRGARDQSPVAEITSWQAAHGCPVKPMVDP